MVYRRLLSWRVRLRTWLRREDSERELDAELQSWVDEMTARAITSGAPPADARRAALREAGGLLRVKDACRDSWRTNHRDDWTRDVRHGLRSLRRTPALTAIAVLTLASGIGASTAIFGQVKAVFLTPLPVDRPSRRCCSAYRVPTR